MLSTLFDLLSAAAFSKSALMAERERLISTLETLRISLAPILSGQANTEFEANQGQFSNAASDLFCQARLLATSPNSSSARIEDLAAQIEYVVLMLQRRDLNTHKANRLLNALDAEIARVKCAA